MSIVDARLDVRLRFEFILSDFLHIGELLGSYCVCVLGSRWGNYFIEPIAPASLLTLTYNTIIL